VLPDGVAAAGVACATAVAVQPRVAQKRARSACPANLMTVALSFQTSAPR
jgi:hypothetical protein